MNGAQRGFTLVDTAIATGIAAIAIAGFFYGVAATARFGAHHTSPHAEAALAFARAIARTAQNVWKYGSPGTAPSGTAASAAGTATVSMASSANGATLHVVVRYSPDPGDDGSLTLDVPLSVRAPFPGDVVTRPGLVPAPTPTP